MVRVDDKQVLFAAQKLNLPELQPFVGWLREERERVMELMTTAPSDRVHILQGRAQALGEVLELVENSTGLLNKLEGRN